MRLAVIIKAEHKKELPTAAELREAGFAVSTALGAGRDANEADGPLSNRCVGEESDTTAHGRSYLNMRLPERQSP